MLRRWYSQRLFPCLCDWALSTRALHPYRQSCLSDVSGKVLEIGFGTGLNLEFYPSSVTELHVVDVNPGMHKRAVDRIARTPFPVHSHLLSGEFLPFPDQQFDAVVSTFTLCSIPDVAQALSEVTRVLRPSGRFCFLEHGLSPELSVAAWQHRLNSLQNLQGDGCHLNRAIPVLVREALLKLEPVPHEYLPHAPKFIGCLFRGTAFKPS